MKRTVFFIIILAFCSVAHAQNIKVKGSAELLPVVDRWAISYTKAHPATPVVSLGGGTSIGISSLAEGSADIATAERALTESEVQRLHAPIDVVFATDALLFVVHPTNPVKSISMDQLRDVYSGKITNWSELGGPNLPIHAMAIGTNFGMTSLVQDKIMKGAKWGPNVRVAASEHDLLYSVWQDPSAISYTGMALGKEFKHLAISKEKGGTAYNATTENIQAGRYTLVHSVHLYMTDKSSSAAKDFATWTLSHDGQQQVANAGIWMLSSSERDHNRARIR